MRPELPPHASDTLAAGLEAPEEVSLNGGLRFALRLRNTTGRALELRLLGRDVAFDLIVRDATDRIVWERLEGETVMSILRLETIAAGGSLVLEGSWDLRANDGTAVPSGRYRLQGLVPTDLPDPIATPVVELRIAPPP